jgi:hypothetical protein
MISLTYDEWKRLNYGVIKGEHSSERNTDGICTFTEYQVIPIRETFHHSRSLFSMPEERGFPPSDD